MNSIKNIKPGMSFTTPDSRGTVYTAERVHVGPTKTTVDYRFDDIRGTFTSANLATCTIV